MCTATKINASLCNRENCVRGERRRTGFVFRLVFFFKIFFWWALLIYATHKFHVGFREKCYYAKYDRRPGATRLTFGLYYSNAYTE